MIIVGVIRIDVTVVVAVHDLMLESMILFAQTMNGQLHLMFCKQKCIHYDYE